MLTLVFHAWLFAHAERANLLRTHRPGIPGLRDTGNAESRAVWRFPGYLPAPGAELLDWDQPNQSWATVTVESDVVEKLVATFGDSVLVRAWWTMNMMSEVGALLPPDRHGSRTAILELMADDSATLRSLWQTDSRARVCIAACRVVQPFLGDRVSMVQRMAALTGGVVWAPLGRGQELSTDELAHVRAEVLGP